MSSLIEPRLLQGFRDYPPAAMLPKERVLETARRVYRSYGYSPIDTPALEYAEVLLGKGGGENDRLVYRFKDHGDRDVALRFDLTVPFARFSATNVPQLGTPFKRYAMGPVWRGERPGQGRYREFWQCDFDTIGTTTNASDIEVALVINDLFTALGFEKFTIRVNNRLLLNGLLAMCQLSDRATEVLRILDKLGKIGSEGVDAELAQLGLKQEVIELLQVLQIKGNDEALEAIKTVKTTFEEGGVAISELTNSQIREGTRNLTELLSACRTAGVPEGRIVIDLSIARGLDYYTGTIYETFLDDKPDIGSVCSGGRYDNLAGTYTKQVLPGVGASLGVDRLLAAMEELKHPWMTGTATPAEVLVINFDSQRIGDYQRVARSLRAAGVGVEVYPEVKRPKNQFEYADKRGFKVAVIAGGDEFGRGVWKVKDLAKRVESEVTEAELVAKVQGLLS